MQGYLNDYQHLLRQCRTENAALKRELEAARDGELPPEPRGRNDRSRVEEPASRPGDLQLPPIETPPLDFPPVDRSSADETRASDIYDDARTQPPMRISLNSDANANNVLLSGEVLPNDQGGPRLVVDLAPRSSAGEPARHTGQVSLMVLAPNESGAPENLARWDFTASEVAAAAGQSPTPHTTRFHLELPADLPQHERTELWVRLVSDDGMKLLASAPVELHQAGTFASAPQTQHDGTHSSPVIQVNYEAPNPNAVRVPTTPSPSGDGWSIARPGEPQRLDEADHPSTWRPSTEPMPIAVSTPTKRPNVDPGALVPPKNDKKAMKGLPWSPDRLEQTEPVVQSDEVASTPRPVIAPRAWSPTR
jgi:hypothetical protein